MRQAVVSLALVLALVAAPVSPAFASHFEFLAQDPGRQLSLTPLKDNYVYYWWGRTNASLRSWIDPLLLADVLVVRNAWQQAAPRLVWGDIIADEATAEIAFKAGACPNNLPACVRYTKRHIEDTQYNASFWAQAEIFIDVTKPWSVAGRRGAIAHEIGHLYGLHERYNEGSFPFFIPSCNDGETTAMDASKLDAQGLIVHCDGLEAPVGADVDRVTRFWSHGQAVFQAPTTTGTVATFPWKDESWSEYDDQLQIQWHDPSTQQWVLLEYRDTFQDIGVHRLTEDRTLVATVDRTAYGKPASYFAVCNVPYFISWDTWGSGACSEAIFVN